MYFFYLLSILHCALLQRRADFSFKVSLLFEALRRLPLCLATVLAAAAEAEAAPLLCCISISRKPLLLCARE